MRVDTGKGERRGIEIGAREGLHMPGESLPTFQLSTIVHVQGNGGNLQQGIGLGVESGSFDIDGDRQKTAKTLGDGRGLGNTHDNRIRDLPAFGDGRGDGYAVLTGEPAMKRAGMSLTRIYGSKRLHKVMVGLITTLAAIGPAWASFNLGAITDTPDAPATREVDNTLLWKVERSGLRPSYVFATINSDDPRVAHLPPTVVRAFQLSDAFAMELIPDHAALSRMSAAMFITAGPDLEAMLGEDYFKKVATLVDKHGIAARVLRKLKPWVVFTALTMPKPDDGVFLDAVLYGAALVEGKNVHGLETADEQVSILEKIRLVDQVAILKDVVDHYSMLSRIRKEMVKRYAQGDLDGVAALQEESLVSDDQHLIRTFRQHLVDDRNLRIVNRILPRIEEQNAFIAIDAVLLPGDQGILQLLRQRGYHISPVY
jgi:uncharacterized protein YbaP (TraB family)